MLAGAKLPPAASAPALLSPAKDLPVETAGSEQQQAHDGISGAQSLPAADAANMAANIANGD